jgi:tRNA A-37 threonylcarbamoyl transferase component Bud32
LERKTRKFKRKAGLNNLKEKMSNRQFKRMKPMANRTLDDWQKEELLACCRQIAGSRRIVGACIFGARVSGYGTKNSGLHTLLVVRNYPSRLMVYPKLLNDMNVLFLVVDSGLFERDVEQAIIGEFVAEKLMLPYQSLINPEYLWQQELKLKKRVIWELLENLVLEYPEMSHELVIKPKFFLYEDMNRKARLFPLVTYSFLNTLRNDLRKQNAELMMQSYLEAIIDLSKEGWLEFTNDQIKVNKIFIDDVKKRRIRLRALLRTVRRGVLTHALRALPGVIQPIIEDQELFLRAHGQAAEEKLMFQLDTSQKYLLIPTPKGLVPLSDTTSIEDFVQDHVPNGKIAKIEPLGGVLNTVYLVSFDKDGEPKRIVVKKFEDWFAFKWFPLAFWSIGTRSFAVLGQARLEREYSINQFLGSHGFAVPKILHVSSQHRLIFEEYIEGTNMTEIVKQLVSSKRKAERELALIRKVGEKMARAHSLDVVLGDCKPENIIVTQEEDVAFLDLEQATRDGNKPWDIAEFLYYSGHYVSPIRDANVAEQIAEDFIEGYLRGGGKRELVRRAWSAQYTKVFSIFTPPHVIFAISRICRNIDKQNERHV